MLYWILGNLEAWGQISEISQKEPSVALENELSSLSTHRSTRIKPNHQSLQALRSFQVASGVLQSSVSRVMWTETMSQPPTLGWQTKDTEDFAQIYPKRPTKGSNKTCHILGSATVQDVATSELWRQNISTEGVRNFAFMHLNLSHGKKKVLCIRKSFDCIDLPWPTLPSFLPHHINLFDGYRSGCRMPILHQCEKTETNI